MIQVGILGLSYDLLCIKANVWNTTAKENRIKDRKVSQLQSSVVFGSWIGFKQSHEYCTISNVNLPANTFGKQI